MFYEIKRNNSNKRTFVGNLCAEPEKTADAGKASI